MRAVFTAAVYQGLETFEDLADECNKDCPEVHFTGEELRNMFISYLHSDLQRASKPQLRLAS
jgi:hypothetical protein